MADTQEKSLPIVRRLWKFTFRTAFPIVIATIICLLIIEVGIRIAYRIRNSQVEYVMIPYMVRNFGMTPPWADGLRIIEPDDVLMFHGRPNAYQKYLDLFCPMHTEEERKALLRRFSPSIPDSFRSNPVWEVSLNSDGFRDVEFPQQRTAKTIRIVCLGDSWTFGSAADQNQTYPRRLAALLEEQFPTTDIEVLNLGFLAYSSHEGLELLKQKALALHPDIVLIGYAMNDASISGWHDKDVLVPKPNRFSLKHFIRDNSEIYKLAGYLGQLKKFESVTMADTIKAVSDPNDEFLYESWVSADALEAKDYERLETKVRVPPADYDRNIREMIRLVTKQGAVPILLHNELRPGSPYQSLLEKISLEENVTLVDNCTVIGEARQQIETDMEQKLGLQSAAPYVENDSPGPVDVVFRVYMDRAAVPKAMSIVGPYSQLGDNVPNKILMFDDGTHGDQKAGDNVWSYSATFSPGQKIFYVYTNSGNESHWENLDLPKVRSFTVPAAGATIYRPIETFGKLYLQADGFHTNAEGHDLMARAVRDALVKNEKFQSLLHRGESTVAGPAMR